MEERENDLIQTPVKYFTNQSPTARHFFDPVGTVQRRDGVQIRLLRQAYISRATESTSSFARSHSDTTNKARGLDHYPRPFKTQSGFDRWESVAGTRRAMVDASPPPTFFAAEITFSSPFLSIKPNPTAFAAAPT